MDGWTVKSTWVLMVVVNGGESNPEPQLCVCFTTELHSQPSSRFMRHRIRTGPSGPVRRNTTQRLPSLLIPPTSTEVFRFARCLEASRNLLQPVLLNA